MIKIILESLASKFINLYKTIADKEPRVRMTAMGASSIDFELLVWISENPNELGVGSSNMSSS